MRERGKEEGREGEKERGRETDRQRKRDRERERGERDGARFVLLLFSGFPLRGELHSGIDSR